MNDKLIEYSWLEEFGDSGHVSLHCYRLAYSKGWSDRDKEISALTQGNEGGHAE